LREGKRRDLLIVVIALAVALRLLHLVQASSDLFFAAPVIDARTNVEDATYLVETSWLGPKAPYWKPPLYPYVLALVRAVAGPSPWLPRLLQIGLDALTCFLAYVLGARLFSARVGLGAAALVAIYGPLIYFSGELVSASLAVFVYLATLLLALRAQAAPSSWRWLGCGAMLGATALARPEALLLVPMLLPFSLRGRPRRWRHAGALLTGVALLVGPVTIRNATWGGDPTLISANGGINLYVGANRAYRGMVGVRPGPEWERLMRDPQSDGIDRPDSRASAFHARRALGLMADDPIGATGHALKKAVLFVHGHELASNQDLYQARRESHVLAATLWLSAGLYFPLGLMLPFAVIGLAAASWRRPELRLLAGYLAALIATAMLFFVTARHRAPAVPVLAVFAASGFDWLLGAARARRWRELTLRLAIALVALVIANGRWVFAEDRAVYRRAMEAEHHHYRGTVLFDHYQRYDEAVVELQHAIALAPRRASTHYNLGQTYARMGRAADALAAMAAVVRAVDDSPGEEYFTGPAWQAMNQALRTDPELRGTPFGLGLVCYQEQSWPCAIDRFRALADKPFLGRTLTQSSVARLEAGDAAAAVADLEEAATLRPYDADTRLALAVAYRQLGDDTRRAEAMQAFRVLDWPRGERERRLAGRRPIGAFARQALDVMRADPH
jgi:4-amino-4-deoxy-L-arabinose transferase-like glycosyltransferase